MLIFSVSYGMYKLTVLCLYLNDFIQPFLLIVVRNINVPSQGKLLLKMDRPLELGGGGVIMFSQY